MVKRIEKIVVVGSGNIAYHVVRAFRQQGRLVIQLHARKSDRSRQISDQFRVPVITAADKLSKDADLYLLAVKDEAIREVALSLGLRNQLLVHTSGATPLDALSHASSRLGVFYPLQSLTFGKEKDLYGIPICIEASQAGDLDLLKELADAVSGNVWAIDSEKRKHLHLAAVFAANFTHRMYAIASQLLEDQGIPFEILAPLINETTTKAVYRDPRKDQTGPAVRGDMKIIRQHMEMLKDKPAYREIYRLVSESIMNNQIDPDEEL